MTDRERLAKLLMRACYGKQLGNHGSVGARWNDVANDLLAAGVTLPPEPPPPPKVWPGLDAMRLAQVRCSGGGWKVQLSSAEYTAIAAEGWRQMVKSLPDASGHMGLVNVWGTLVSRPALLAVADGYGL